MDEIRIVVVDDHAVVRHGLKLYLDLESDLSVVGEASDGDEAIEAVQRLSPDVVLMDLSMPGTDGVAATLTIDERHPDVRVVVLSSFLDEDKLVSVLRSGAVGYVSKEAEPAEIAAAVRAAYSGEPIPHPEAVRRLRAMSEPQRARAITILFTDIVGSTRLIRELGDDAARDLFREHDTLARDAFRRHRGREVAHLGDGFMAAFAQVCDALGCAVDVQREVRARSLPLAVRAGLHTGDVISEDGNYFGAAVVLARRVADEAGAGQVLVSEHAYGVAGSQSVPLVDVGTRECKGLGACRVYEAMWSGGA